MFYTRWCVCFSLAATTTPHNSKNAISPQKLSTKTTHSHTISTTTTMKSTQLCTVVILLCVVVPPALCQTRPVITSYTMRMYLSSVVKKNVLCGVSCCVIVLCDYVCDCVVCLCVYAMVLCNGVV